MALITCPNKPQETFHKPQKPPKSIVECPYCKSTKTKKISDTGRCLSTGLFGIASKKWVSNGIVEIVILTFKEAAMLVSLIKCFALCFVLW